MMRNNPQFPLYIPSKGRYNIRYTSDYLSILKLPHYIIVEEQEYLLYKDKIKDNKYATLLILDKNYQSTYDTFDDLGDTKSKGPGPARNFAWDHSISYNYLWHWVMDDNIMNFRRFNNNLKIKVNSGAIFKAMEDFCLRYSNVAMAGPNYQYFAKQNQLIPPYICNTRIYSCNLIRNDCSYRWRGRYNEDTDLSLRMLKDGWCTIQFNAFLQDKLTTQMLDGGNTEAFYAKEGTLPKSEMLKKMHPDVTKVVWKFNRWHHDVDYSYFKKHNILNKKRGIIVEDKINNYNMVIKTNLYS